MPSRDPGNTRVTGVRRSGGSEMREMNDRKSGANRFPLVAGFVVVLLILLALMWVIGGSIL